MASKDPSGTRLPPGVVVHTLQSAVAKDVKPEFKGRPMAPGKDGQHEDYFVMGTEEVLVSTIRQIPETVMRNIRGFQIIVVA